MWSKTGANPSEDRDAGPEQSYKPYGPYDAKDLYWYSSNLSVYYSPNRDYAGNITHNIFGGKEGGEYTEADYNLLHDNPPTNVLH